jgi:hypothetical protein
MNQKLSFGLDGVKLASGVIKVAGRILIAQGDHVAVATLAHHLHFGDECRSIRPSTMTVGSPAINA